MVTSAFAAAGDDKPPRRSQCWSVVTGRDIGSFNRRSHNRDGAIQKRFTPAA